jgi:hypothetical protein
MITDIDYPTYTIRAGDSFAIAVNALSPIAVAIKCFVSKPPPPGYRPCPECGSFQIASGEVLRLVASETTFEHTGGTLEVTIRDAEADVRTLRLKVAGREEERGTPALTTGYA